MRLVILGANGQVGHELQNSLKLLGEVIALDRSHADLTKFEELKNTLIELNPDVIINAAAYTAVDKAEEDKETVMLVNGVAPGIIAETAKQLDALFVHFSTDYVFDGKSTGPYYEEDTVNPVNCYGDTKLRGELEVQKTGGKFLIFRTAWVYSLHGKNFLKTILQLASEREELNIVDDQIGAPTWAGTIADVTAACVATALDRIKNNQFVSELYHLTAKGEVSWYEFASKIVELAKKDQRWDIKVKKINPIPSSSYPTPARRPMYSVLANKKIEELYGNSMPDWNDELLQCLK